MTIYGYIYDYIWLYSHSQETMFRVVFICDLPDLSLRSFNCLNSDIHLILGNRCFVECLPIKIRYFLSTFTMQLAFKIRMKSY